MAEVVVSVVKITAAGVAPTEVETGASILISAVVLEETTRYSYPTAPTLGDATLMTNSKLQIDRTLRKE